ncbi:hypothetical protein UFOVP1290_314 [uncultured Caudovirales phage]|uniref:Uncharacterized protein n=1 Tax=uncultured Caudovirales phage TaxID=2100421 RepID=A0A6J5RXP0_9CAUD|nr:hypothetical protein UFOVP1290_314 [uncultured Caudovirales phage]
MVTVKSDKPIKTKTCICSNCGYELEYTGEDVLSYNKTDYGGDTDTYYYIICPRQSCQKQNNVRNY